MFPNMISFIWFPVKHLGENKLLWGFIFICAPNSSKQCIYICSTCHRPKKNHFSGISITLFIAEFLLSCAFFKKKKKTKSHINRFVFLTSTDLYPAVSCRSWWRRWWIWTLSWWKRTQMLETKPELEAGPADTPQSASLKPVEDQHLPFFILLLCLLSTGVFLGLHEKWRWFTILFFSVYFCLEN